MDVSERKREREKAFATWADRYEIVDGKIYERGSAEAAHAKAAAGYMEGARAIGALAERLRERAA